MERLEAAWLKGLSAVSDRAAMAISTKADAGQLADVAAEVGTLRRQLGEAEGRLQPLVEAAAAAAVIPMSGASTSRAAGPLCGQGSSISGRPAAGGGCRPGRRR